MKVFQNKIVKRREFVKSEFDRLTKEGYRGQWIINKLANELFLSRQTIYNDLKK